MNEVPVGTSGRSFRLFGPGFKARYRSIALYTFLLFLRKERDAKTKRKLKSAYLGGGGGSGGGGGGGGEGSTAKERC